MLTITAKIGYVHHDIGEPTTDKTRALYYECIFAFCANAPKNVRKLLHVLFIKKLQAIYLMLYKR